MYIVYRNCTCAGTGISHQIKRSCMMQAIRQIDVLTHSLNNGNELKFTKHFLFLSVLYIDVSRGGLKFQEIKGREA